MRRLFAVAVVVAASGLAGLPAVGRAAPAPVPAASPSAGALKPVTWEALRGIVSVREPQIAPDGKQIVYVRGVGDFKADREQTELVLLDVATGARRVLTRDKVAVHTPRWSPSGDRIAFLASPAAMKPPQLFVLSMAGGDSVQVTTAETGLASFAWRPDGNGFAYLSQDAPPKTKGVPEAYVPSFTVTDEHFLTREPTRPVHVWTVAADGTGAKQLTKGAASASAGAPPEWTPNGTALVVHEQPDGVFAHLTKSHTVVVDVASGTERPVRDGVDAGGVLSHDGKRVALSLPRHASAYLQHDVSVRDLTDGHEVQSAVAIDRNVRWWQFTPDDGAVLVGTPDGVRDVLWRYPSGGKPQHVDLGEVDFGQDATVGHDGSIAFVGRRRDDPGEIYVLPPSGAPRKLTNENAFLANYALARRDRVDWQSDDGTAINGVITYPPNYTPGKQYPLVLDIHGGPVSTSTWDFGTLEGQLCQVLATDGFLVLQPNYRGSDDEGDAFLQAIVPHVTSGPGRDNLAGVEALKKMGIVDPARIGVSGWSGGGLQTGWLVGHASYWRAAVAGAGVYDWWQQAVLADINEQFTEDFLGGASPFTPQGRATLVAESPITYADAIKTPLLILSDTGDQRVPITQAYALYHALHDRGKTVEFVAYPRAGHFPTDPVGRESVLKLWAGWFERWMK
ncbi:MAG: S9 family peptidase [Candidatus Eremiobacteraeota bacterium]|nr:S9 family peptidase [Candidatus Eremiobacteraeota bacterium]